MAFSGSWTTHMCSIIIMSKKILELLCRNHFFYRRTSNRQSTMVKQVYPYNFVVRDMIRKALHYRKLKYILLHIIKFIIFLLLSSWHWFFCQYSCAHLKASVTILADFGPEFNSPFRRRSKHQTKNHSAYH